MIKFLKLSFQLSSHWITLCKNINIDFSQNLKNDHPPFFNILLTLAISRLFTIFVKFNWGEGIFINFWIFYFSISMKNFQLVNKYFYHLTRLNYSIFRKMNFSNWTSTFPTISVSKSKLWFPRGCILTIFWKFFGPKCFSFIYILLI